MPDPRQKLYSALSSKFDLGTFDEFNSKMNNPESRKKLYNSVSSNFDLGSYDEFESKVAPLKKKDGTKPNSTSTSVSQKQVSEQTNGSSGTPKFKLAGEKEKPSANVDYANYDLEQNSAKVDIPKQNKSLVVANTAYNYALNNVDKSVSEERYKDEVDNYQFLDGVKQGMKNTFNTFIGTPLTKLNESLGGNKDFTISQYKPLEKELKQAKSELQEEFGNKKFTDQDVQERAKKIFIDKDVQEQMHSLIDKALPFGYDREGVWKELKLNELRNNDILREKVASAEVFKTKIQEFDEFSKTINKENPTQEEIEKFNTLKTEATTALEGLNYLAKNYDNILEKANTDQEKLELFKYNYNDLEKNLDLFYSSSLNIIGGTLKLAGETNQYIDNKLGLTPIGGEVQALIGDEMMSDAKKTAEPFYRYKATKLNDWSDLGSFTAQLTSEQLPILASIYLGGNAGITATSMSSGGQKINDLEEQEKQPGGIIYSDGEKLATAWLYAGAEFFPEKIGTARILKDLERTVSSASTASRKLFKDSFIKQTTNGAKKLAYYSSLEGGTELVTAQGQITIDEELLNIVKTDAENNEQRMESFFSGALMGGGMSVVGGGLGFVTAQSKLYSERKDLKEVQSILDNVGKIQNEIETNVLLNDKERTELYQEMNVLSNQAFDVISKNANKANDFSVEEKSTLLDINLQQAELKSKYEELKKSNFSNEIKNKKVQELDAEFSKLEENRNTILKGEYNTIKPNEAQQEATTTETKQETQPQAEIQKTEQEVLETPIVENETAPSQVDNVDGNIRPGNNVVEPNGTTEQENNQAGDIQAADNRRNVEVKREIKIADKGQSYTVEKTDLGLVIKDKKGKAPSKVTERKILDEYSKTINFTQGERVDDSSESSAETYIDDIASKSKNASEIAEAIAYVEVADMNEGKVDPIKVAIANALGEKAVEKSSFTNINDRNNITQSIALQYFAPSGKGKGLDQIAMEVEYEIYGDYNANNPRISEEDIANFMVDNPRGSLEFLNRNKNATLEKLRAAFTDVTGLPAKQQFIETAINQNTAFKNEIFNGNSLYLYSDEDLLSLQNQREEFEKSIEDGNQSENKQTTNEIAEGINNQPDNKDGKQTPGIQKDSGSKNSRESKLSNGSSQAELGSSNDAYSRQQDAYNRLGERIRKAEKELERQLTNFEKEDLERTTALEYAKENNIWIEDFYSLGSRKLVGGQENTLVLDEKEGVVYKSNNLLNSKNSITELFEGVQAHNSIFLETKYEFVGYTGIDKGTDKVPYVEPIFKQDFITEADQANKEEIANYMTSIGFEKITDTSFKNKDYTVFDLHPRNVLKDSNGTIYVVDAEFKKNETLNNKNKEVLEEIPELLDKKKFFKKYKAVHKDIRSKTESEKISTAEKIKKEGFFQGMNVNALPLYEGAENGTDATSKWYKNKKGDVVYLLTKEGFKNGPNGYMTQKGFKPTDNEIIVIQFDGQSVYDAYINQNKKEVTPEEKSKIDAFKKWLDDTDKRLKDFGEENLGINIPIVVARGAVKAMKAAVSTAQTVQEIIQAGLDFVKQSEWYQNLSKKEQNDVDANFQDYINKPFQGTETKKSRLKIEEEIQERLDNNESEQDIIDSISDRRDKMIAQDYIERQKNLSVPEVRKKVAESFEKADEALQDKKTTTEKIDKAFRNFIARFFDRQFVPKFILNKAGGRLVRNYLIASKGATGYAKQMYDEAYAKIYKGLTSAEIKTLDKMIQLRRFIAIDKNRAENNMPDVVHPDFINRQDAEIELAELEKEFGVEKFKDLTKRADAYFDEFRGLLTEMQKSGLISKESLDMFFEIDYQPRMFLEFLQNNETDFVPETSSNSSLSSEQIRKLEEGLNTSLIYDSQYLLSRSMNIRAKSIAMNNTNKKLVEFIEKQAKVVDDLKNKTDKTQKEKDTIKYFEELSKRVKINPIIGFTDTGSPKYKYALPNGFKNAYYYIDGVKHSVMMEEVFHEQYFDAAKGFLNGNAKEVASMVSGTAIVKALATGNNPTFFITNTPRDFFFIATFSEEYGMSVLVNMAKLAKDAFLGVRDIKKGNGNFKNFVKYGGMMDFLKDQGKLKHTEIQKLFDKVDNKKREGIGTVLNFVTASKLQMYSEIGFRMAVFNRSVKNQLKELGYTKIEDVKYQSQVDDIYTNAVASARGIMDFNQGGKITKDADAFIPYLNAATQGTRVMFDNFRERPFETTFRTAQTAGVFSGLAIGLSVAAFSWFGDDDDEMTPTERYLYAKKGVSKYDQTNYFIIFTGQKTESGQYSYIRIAKPQQITPFFSMTDGIMTSFIKAKIGDESPTDAIDNVMFAFEKNISPLEFSVTGNIARNPFLKSALSYSTGYDFYRGEDLSYLRGKVPVPAEGFESKTVEDFYKKIGEESGMSPVRFKAAVESFITTPSTSPYVGFLYGGLDAMASDKEGKEVMEKLGKDLLKSTFNRVRKETTDFNRRLENNKALKKKIEQVEIDNLKTKSLFKKYADAYTNKEMSVAEISKELEKVAQDNPFEAKRLKKMIKDKIKNKDVSPYVFEIKYAKSAESKALMLIDLFGDDLKDISKLEPEEKKLLFQMKKMGAINKEVLFEYNRIITE